MNKEIIDPTLGRMVHDGYYYEGVFEADGSSKPFSIGTYQVADLESRIERGRTIYRSLPALIESARKYATERLLSLKNETWEEEDERPITAHEFHDRVMISSVTLDHDNEVVMYFDDGGLFFGHDILVTLTPDGEFDRAELQG